MEGLRELLEKRCAVGREQEEGEPYLPRQKTRAGNNVGVGGVGMKYLGFLFFFN